MNGDKDIVILSPSLLFDAGREMVQQSDIIDSNIERVLELIDETSKMVNINEEDLRISDIKNKSKQLKKMRLAMLQFGDLLIKFAGEWQSKKDSGELDAIFSGLEDA